MPRICTKVALPGGGVAIITTSSSVNPNDPCAFCVKTRDKSPPKHDVLCDFPIHKGKDTKRYTCSRRLCKSCSFSPAPNVDFCPPHATLVIDHELAEKLVPLLQSSEMSAHKVALDLVDGVALSEVSTPEAKQHRRFIPKGLVDWHEFYTERAAIYEFEAGMTKADAERRARADAGPRPEPTPEKKQR